MMFKNLGGSDATVFGIPVYGDDCPKWVDFLYNVRMWIRERIWDFRYRFVKKHQHHILRLGIAPGYSDPRWKIMMAVKAILEQYIQEYGSEEEFIAYIEQVCGWGDAHGQAEREKEVLEVYHWFKNLKDDGEHDYEEEQKWLRRFVEIRGYLWT